MKRSHIIAAILATTICCNPISVRALDITEKTEQEWMQYLEEMETNWSDYGIDFLSPTDHPLVTGKSDSKTVKVMIDPGHYGNYYNPSTVIKGYYESAMTWKLSNYLKEELELLGVQADLTRSSIDENPGLQPRGRMSSGYDFFISIHSNAASYSSIDYPVAICYQNLDWTTIDDTSREIGQLLTDTVATVMNTKQKGIIWQRKSEEDRDGNGVLDDEWYGVLCGSRYVGTPGILMEHSFHTNYAATAWLMNDDNLHLMAKKEASVIADYFKTKKAADFPVSERQKGDIDGDGSVTVEDAVQVLEYYAKQSAGLAPVFEQDIQLSAADYNGDENISVEDAVCILEYYAKQSAGLQPEPIYIS